MNDKWRDRQEDTELAVAALNLMNAQETSEQALQLAHWALDILEPATPDDYVVARQEVKLACARYSFGMQQTIDIFTKETDDD